jgi:ubiquinone/menaquinone biosynthesis C-methylase UbiE
MVAQYDHIAEQYRHSTGSAIRTHVESFSLLGRIGDVRGKTVLDLACGEGFFTRRMKEVGAARVVGVDISPVMIDLANQQERDEPLGLEYVCADVRDLTGIGQFDIVIAAYLLHYARSEAQLLQMCERIGEHLAPGGRFVTLNENPEQDAGAYAGYAQYGFNKTVEMPRGEGSEITYWMVAGREMFKFHAYHYRRETYERVLRASGFSEVCWSALEPDPEGVEQFGTEYWREYLDHPPVVILEARA